MVRLGRGIVMMMESERSSCNRRPDQEGDRDYRDDRHPDLPGRDEKRSAQHPDKERSKRREDDAQQDQQQEPVAVARVLAHRIGITFSGSSDSTGTGSTGFAGVKYPFASAEIKRIGTLMIGALMARIRTMTATQSSAPSSSSLRYMKAGTHRAIAKRTRSVRRSSIIINSLSGV